MISDNECGPNDDDGDVLDIGQAASRLGVSPDAVRKRIRRGQLRAYKVDGMWRIVLPAVSSVLSEPTDVPSRTEARSELDNVRDAGFFRAMQENERLLALSEEQAATLREQAQTIEAQRQTIAELTARLLAREQPAQEPPSQPPATPATMPHNRPEKAVAPRRRRSWWERLLGR
jgi:excisionase family DNA binding protein